MISGNTDENRVVVIERPQEMSRDFFAPLARGEELTSELLSRKPDPFFVKGPDKGDMPEIFGLMLGPWVVKEKVKQIIEDIEPGIHSFIAVNLRVKGSEKDWGRYCLLCPGQAVNAVIIEETDFAEGKGYPGFAVSQVLSSFGDTVLDPALIAGRHLWRGGRTRIGKSTPFYGYLFCSDEFAERITNAGVEGWRFRRCKSPSLHS